MVWNKGHVSGQFNPNKCLCDSGISGRVHDRNYNLFILVFC